MGDLAAALVIGSALAPSPSIPSRAGHSMPAVIANEWGEADALPFGADRPRGDAVRDHIVVNLLATAIVQRSMKKGSGT